MNRLNAFAVPSASCVAYNSAGASLGWTVGNVSAQFEYELQYTPLLDLPIQVMKGGSVTIRLANAPSASLVEPGYLQELRITLGPENGAAQHDIRFFGCEKMSQSLEASQPGNGAFLLNGSITYAFAKVNTGTVTLTMDNKHRGWYF